MHLKNKPFVATAASLSAVFAVSTDNLSISTATSNVQLIVCLYFETRFLRAIN